MDDPVGRSLLGARIEENVTANRARTPVFLLAATAMVLLLIASLSGIVPDDGGRPYRFSSVWGEEVEIYGGEGLYRYDSVYKAAMFRGFDWANLVVVLPLFVVGIGLYRQGKVKGQLLLTALFTYLAYIYVIGVMGNAFNAMFLVWTALFSVGVFGLYLTIAGMDMNAFRGSIKENFPRRGLAVYVLLVGAILLVQYLSEIFTAYATANAPASLDHYTTLELASFELGLMIPLHFLGGIALWKEKAWGYLLSILLAFAAFMTFVALSIALLLLYFSYGQGSLPDMAITIAIAVVATGFSALIFSRVRG
jgi:hypothetical protein